MSIRSLNYQRILIVITLTVLILVGGSFLYKKTSFFKSPTFQLQTKTANINRSWSFAATDRAGAAVTQKISFAITAVEKTNQIYVRNKPVRTASGKSFLVLSLELKNDTDKRLYLYPSDFVRLTTSDGKKFEADFRNPRLEIAPISTKKDKLAFIVDDKNSKFELQIGEITGNKDAVTVSF